MIKKKILAIDLILVVGTLMIISAFVYYNNLTPDIMLSPDRTILFEIKDVKEIIFIDDEKIYLEDGLIIALESGTHYLKVERAERNELWKFEIVDSVSFKFLDLGNGKFAVVNAGPENLDVKEYQYDKLKESYVLGGVG